MEGVDHLLIYEIGDKTDCRNYRDISRLLSRFVEIIETYHFCCQG